MLFPHAIKTLTNNTELISTCNILGYRVCYSIIQELATENAYRISNLQKKLCDAEGDQRKEMQTSDEKLRCKSLLLLIQYLVGENIIKRFGFS